MMIALPLMLAMQAAQTPPSVPPTRLQACLALAETTPDAGIEEANAWLAEAPGIEPRLCLGVAFYYAERFPAALAILLETASAADTGYSPRRGEIWEWAGLAALATGDTTAARAYFTRATDAGTLTGPRSGDTLALRARAAVMAGDEPAARTDLDRAVVVAPQNGSIWLLSATLARRMRDFTRAQADIQQAAALTPRDPAVALEAGNIAWMTGNNAVARRSWESVIAVGPGTAAAVTARAQIAEMQAEEDQTVVQPTATRLPEPPR